MMKKMTLIKEFICGEEGKPAFIVDAQDRMLRTSTVVRIEKYEADVLVETKNSVYCTARFYDFGYMSQSLIAADGGSVRNELEFATYFYDFGYMSQSLITADGGSVRNELEFATYDIAYKNGSNESEVYARMLNEGRTLTEDNDAKIVLRQLCQEFPNIYLLRQFCRVKGGYCLLSDGSDHRYMYFTKNAIYIVAVGLLKLNGYHIRLHCYRQKSGC